jgi:MFS family permease
MGLLNGAVSVGGLIGSYLSSLLLSHFSRRNCLLLLDFCSIIAGILIFIPNFYTFLVFRGFQGICAGAFTSISPLIIKEITPLEVLGKMGSFSQLNLGFGVFFGQLLSYILKKWTGDESGE